ncbi:MAG: hypothetical protein IKI22_01665 [Neisseriaceae bacterium]|nr:hypothetical protein [Neisseriaceae bacterium]
MSKLIDNKQQRLDKLLQAIVQDVEKFLSRRKKLNFMPLLLIAACIMAKFYGRLIAKRVLLTH